MFPDSEGQCVPVCHCGREDLRARVTRHAVSHLRVHFRRWIPDGQHIFGNHSSTVVELDYHPNSRTTVSERSRNRGNLEGTLPVPVSNASGALSDRFPISSDTSLKSLDVKKASESRPFSCRGQGQSCSLGASGFRFDPGCRSGSCRPLARKDKIRWRSRLGNPPRRRFGRASW